MAAMMLERQISKSVSQKGMAMAFVNEYVPEEDIKKYKLDELWLKERPVHKSIPSHYKFDWTVDREREAFLYWINVGREEESNRMTFVFYWGGETFIVKVDRVPGGSKNYKEQPYRIILELVGIWPSQPKLATREVVLNGLKEALRVFGDEGVRSYVTDTIVEFKNF